MPTTVDFRTERLRRGLSLRQLAVECVKAGAKVDPSQLWRIETGYTKTPNPRLRATLCKLLDLPIDYFDNR